MGRRLSDGIFLQCAALEHERRVEISASHISSLWIFVVTAYNCVLVNNSLVNPKFDSTKTMQNHKSSGPLKKRQSFTAVHFAWPGDQQLPSTSANHQSHGIATHGDQLSL